MDIQVMLEQCAPWRGVQRHRSGGRRHRPGQQLVRHRVVTHDAGGASPQNDGFDWIVCFECWLVDPSGDRRADLDGRFLPWSDLSRRQSAAFLSGDDHGQADRTGSDQGHIGVQWWDNIGMNRAGFGMGRLRP